MEKNSRQAGERKKSVFGNCWISHISPESPPILYKPRHWEDLPADLPADLLTEIFQRLKSSNVGNNNASLKPLAMDVIACAAVCQNWRDVIIEEFYKTPEQWGSLILPISLKQPGPRNNPIQCFIRKEKENTGTYYRLYLGLTPALSGNNKKLLMTAKNTGKLTNSGFLISFGEGYFPTDSYGKLKSNLLSNSFGVYDDSHKKIPSKNSLRRLLTLENYHNVVSIYYESNVCRSLPRTIHCTMNNIPVSGTIFTSTTSAGPIVLRSKAPTWHEQLKRWCINFNGRVTKASIKNFQLVMAEEANNDHPSEAQRQEKVVLQFGKIQTDVYTMDYGYPLSAFQAFAICLSSIAF